MVGPKRHFLPLAVISLSAFFFYSYYHSSLPSSTSELNPNFTVSNPVYAQNYNPSLANFSFIVKVLAFNRLDSLSRCLRSLANADYLGDRVSLHVYIDHFAHQNVSSTATVDQKLSESRRILEFVDGFDWKFGEKLLHYRTTNVGLQAQWLEAWWPSSDNEFVFIVEDDLEVSPLYYEFIKSLIVNFYYNASNYSPSIYGASLQRPRFVPGKHGKKLQLDDKTRLFLYQLVGTWGQILFPKPWKEFRLWYDNNKAKDIKPFLEGMVTTGWYKKMGERIWTPWFIKFIQSHGYFNIYTNFLHERALSVSHRDAGVNYGKTAGPDSQLLDDRSLDFNILEMHPLSSLKWLNIRNYILLSPESDILFDLARRGHPVINVDQFIKGVGLHKLTSQGSQFEAIKSILTKAYVTKKCLENGYNLWVVDGNMLFLSADLFFESKDPNDDFFLATSLELLYVRSSATAKKMWDNNLVSKVVAMAEDLGRKGSLSHGDLSFVHVMAMLLEQNGAKFRKLDETTYGMKIGSANVNKSSLGDKKLVYWSAEMGLESIQNWLEELNLWVVDQENSCAAVVCHKS
ncbi:hypothetical protein K1719_043305 [Acacia pycnantha]|nr:hypothetical protein K1719_043305 [Acacia pycnantha]